MANNFTFYSPTEIVFGRGTQGSTADYIKKYHGSRVLVVYGSERVVKSGLMDSIVAPCGRRGWNAGCWAAWCPTPSCPWCTRASTCAKRRRGLHPGRGGRQRHRLLQAIGYGLANDFDVWDLFDRKNTATGCAPSGRCSPSPPPAAR